MGREPFRPESRFSGGRLPPAFPPPSPTVSERPLLTFQGQGIRERAFLSWILRPGFPKATGALAPGPHWGWRGVCRAVGLFVVRAPSPARVGLKRLTGSKHRASQACRKHSACKDRLLSSGTRDEGSPAGELICREQRGGLLAGPALPQPCLGDRLRRVKNFTPCCCFYQTPLELPNCERKSLFFGGRPY